jgi:putative nucleotidyltransferase with HDIG domain
MNSEKPLMQLIEEHLAGDLRDLPVFHAVAVKLQQLLARRDFPMDEVIDQICGDQALSGQILKVANSSFYAGLSKVATIKDAVVRLGAREIAGLAMMASQGEYYKAENVIIHTHMRGLWTHALSCAVGAKWLAVKAGYGNLAAEAFMGGLLHDIGKLALLKVLDDIDRTRETRALISQTLIAEVLDRMHEAVGLRLLHSWALPESYCNIAVNHHRPDFDGNDILLVMVRLANHACDKIGISLNPRPDIALILAPEAQCLGVKEIVLAELEIVIEDAVSALER